MFFETSEYLFSFCNYTTTSHLLVISVYMCTCMQGPRTYLCYDCRPIVEKSDPGAPSANILGTTLPSTLDRLDS